MGSLFDVFVRTFSKFTHTDALIFLYMELLFMSEDRTYSDCYHIKYLAIGISVRDTSSNTVSKELFIHEIIREQIDR